MAAAQKKNTYTAAEVAVLENNIQEQQAQIEELKRKLEHVDEVFANAQRARFGQSSVCSGKGSAQPVQRS